MIATRGQLIKANARLTSRAFAVYAQSIRPSPVKAIVPDRIVVKQFLLLFEWA